jgi:hypothetical protein
LLDTCKLFFIQHQLIAWINITPAIVEFLLTSENTVSLLERYPFLEFTVNENYPGLNNGKDDLVWREWRSGFHWFWPILVQVQPLSKRCMTVCLSGLFWTRALSSSVRPNSL